MSSPNCPMYIECGFAYSDCDCEIRIFCPDTTSDMHSSCGYEVKDGIAYARYAGGARGGKQAMFNPYHHYASEDLDVMKIFSNIEVHHPQSPDEIDIKKFLYSPTPSYINLKR